MNEKGLADGSKSTTRQQQSEMIVNLGLICNSFLALLKLVFGILGHSRALLADGINSTSDVVYLLVVKAFVRLSGKPADREHPYGHQQFESIAALVVGAFIITTGVAIFWESLNTMFDQLTSQVVTSSIRSSTLWVVLLTIVIKSGLMVQANLVGRRINNPAILAVAKDHRNDIIASAGAGVGILFGILGLTWFDPLAGTIVALLVAKTGIDILRESADELMDSVPGEVLDRQIRAILGAHKEIKAIEEIHAHRFGPYLVVNLTIGIDGALSVFQGDAIATAVENTLPREISMLRHVYVHYHPARTV